MHLGAEILAELGRRGRRYEHLSFHQHRRLKQVATQQELREFLAENKYAQLPDEATPQQVADAIIEGGGQRDAKAAKRSLLVSMGGDPIGALILLALSPLFLVVYVIRCVRSLWKRPGRKS